MNPKPDRTIFYIGGTVLLLIIAIAATSIINNQKPQTDIRAKASVQTGVIYEGIINAVDVGNQSLLVESLTPQSGGMALSGIWTVRVPSTVSINQFSTGSSVLITVDAQTFNIQTHTIEAKNVVVK